LGGEKKIGKDPPPKIVSATPPRKKTPLITEEGEPLQRKKKFTKKALGKKTVWPPETFGIFHRIRGQKKAASTISEKRQLRPQKGDTCTPPKRIQKKAPTSRGKKNPGGQKKKGKPQKWEKRGKNGKRFGTQSPKESTEKQTRMATPQKGRQNSSLQ